MMSLGNCSNRTFMELKYVSGWVRLSMRTRSNRTIMELKSIDWTPELMRFVGF